VRRYIFGTKFIVNICEKFKADIIVFSCIMVGVAIIAGGLKDSIQ
jgi:hypothetical protein